MQSTFDFPLSSGEPPALEDCVDIGVAEPPMQISNAGESAGMYDMYDIYGMSLPAWARVRTVLRQTRGTDMPYTTFIKDLGQLVVGEEGWAVL